MIENYTYENTEIVIHSERQLIHATIKRPEVFKT